MNPSRGRLRTVADVSVILIFLLAIGLPLAGSFFGLELTESLGENRKVAGFPEIQLKRAFLTAFPARFEAFYNDHFGMRNTLIRCLNVARVHWLGMSSSRHVIVGKEGWLYFTQEPVGTDYGAARPFTTEDLERWQRLLETRRDWLARRGIRYLFVVAPDKQSIYPEYLPHALQQREAGASRLDQLLAHLRDHSTVEILDVRAPLREARGREQVYRRIDSHWNVLGAYRCYQEITGALHTWYPGIQAVPRSAFRLGTGLDDGGDVARMLGLENKLPEQVFALVLPTRQCMPTGEKVPVTAPTALTHLQPQAWEHPNHGLPRAVVFHDSFGEGLVAFLAEHFRRTVFVPTYALDAAVVERERPDVVIHEIVERLLREDLPSEPPLPD